MAEQQELSESPTSSPSPTRPATPPPTEINSRPSPTALDFLKELDTHYRNNEAIQRRHPLPSDKQLHKLPRSEKSSASIFQIGPDEYSPPKTISEVEDDPDDNCSIGTTASWIIDNLDFKTPSSSEVDDEEEQQRKGEDPLFERGEPEFIFPFPEGSGELLKNLKREKGSMKTKSGEEKDEKKEDEGVEEVKGEESDDGFTAIPEDVDQVALAAFTTTVLFGGMWALENGYGKALLFQ